MSSNFVADCLAASLSPDTNTRIAAELKLAELFAQPDTGLALSRILVAQDAELPLRQISVDCVVYSKYIHERWSPYFSNFKGGAPPPEIKSQIRDAVFAALSDPVRKIRTLCAHTLSSIANSDWPDEYPDLLNSLISLLSSGSPNSVHGAMQVFTEFIKSDLTEDQILPVMRQLLPVLLSILGAKDQHTPLTRARTVSVFRQCISALYMVKEHYPEPVKEATSSVLPLWLDAFKLLLSIDPASDVSQNWENLAIRIQIFKALDNIQTSFPRAMTAHLKDLVTISLQHLHALYPAFQRYYLSSADSVPATSEDEQIELPHLVCPIFDFITVVARSGKAKSWFVDDNLMNLTSTVFDYAQMTDDDEETWANNANAFIAQEDDESQSYSVRVAGFDLLLCLLEREPATLAGAFHSIVQRTAQTSTEQRNARQSQWWRPLEASLAAIGGQADIILECVEEAHDAGTTPPIDIQSLLIGIVPSVLNLAECPFLQGRGFVFASQFAKLLPEGILGQYLEAAIQVIENDEANIPVKVSAVKAVLNFAQGSDDGLIKPYASRIAKDLGPFLLATTEDTLSLVLEALSVVLDIDKATWLDPNLADSITIAVLEVWKSNRKDPIFLSIISEILSSLAGAQKPNVYETVVKQALPALSSAISSAGPEESWIVSSAIELASSLVQGAPDSNIGPGFFGIIAPNLFNCLLSSDDRDVLQNGVSCLTLIVRKDCQQILSWSDASGSGLDNVLKVIAKVLQNPDESGGLVIGDLIIHLLRRVGDSILPIMPELLSAMAQRMLTAKTATFLQSLIIPFAFLIHNNMLDQVLSLLESTTTDGRSGLNILIQTWCENAETIHGFWPSRISTLALIQLYLSGRPSLQNLTVKGDIIVNPKTKNVIMTRSKTKTIPQEFTSIPFPSKVLKLALHELQMGGEAATFGQNAEFEVESDDGDEEWTEEEKLNQGFKAEEFAMLSEMLGPRGVAFDGDDVLEDNDDEDLKNDPVSTMDMQAHIVSFFKSSATQNTNSFNAFAGQLNEGEKSVLQQVISQ